MVGREGKMTEQRAAVPGTRGAARSRAGGRCLGARGEKPGGLEGFVTSLAGIHK